jgi:uncharacterized protein with HEPN domain
MNNERLVDHMDRMQAAAQTAFDLTEGMSEAQFLADVRTQLAVTMSLVLVGEAAARISAIEPGFSQNHPEIPWTRIKGMRNLIVHDYYRAELPVIWQTARTALPELVTQLENIRHWRAQGE